MVLGRLSTMLRIEVFFSSSMNYMSLDSIIEVFYHLNKMSIATKHIADNNFVFQQDSALEHLARNIVTSLFLTYDPNSPDVIGEPH